MMSFYWQHCGHQNLRFVLARCLWFTLWVMGNFQPERWVYEYRIFYLSQRFPPIFCIKKSALKFHAEICQFTLLIFSPSLPTPFSISLLILSTLFEIFV